MENVPLTQVFVPRKLQALEVLRFRKCSRPAAPPFGNPRLKRRQDLLAIHGPPLLAELTGHHIVPFSSRDE
jgi:hypothetical protein